TRSGDKGSHSNVAVIAYNKEAYDYLKKNLTAEKVSDFFGAKATRFELDNLLALNFILFDILEGGASVSLQWDVQGKGFGQKMLEMDV
ncbi:MAG: hypothetical protein ACK4HV_07410, partial [Parachlamydiaceae bacterium]